MPQLLRFLPLVEMTYNVLNRGNIKTLNAIGSRRSVKHDDKNHTMSENEINKLRYEKSLLTKYRKISPST